MIRGSSEP